MSTITQVRYTNPIRTIQNISDTTQIKENTISVLITLNDILDIHERGIIRKPSAAKPNMLETFKPTIHSLVPELQQLTDDKLYEILEEDDDE